MVNLAEMIAGWAREGAKTGIDCGKMCSECAFRPGSVAQSEPHNVDAAAMALAYNGTFNCHKNGFEDAGKPCAGFLYARLHEAEREKRNIRLDMGCKS